MATVYDKQTGEALACEPVDVPELIASGAYVGKQEDVQPKKRERKAISEE